MIAIFDWDGTLCDSIEHIVDAMQDAASEQGFEPPPATAVRNIVGLGLPQALAQLFPALDRAEHAQLALAYSRHFAAPERGPARLYEGAIATLDGLRARGIELPLWAWRTISIRPVVPTKPTRSPIPECCMKSWSPVASLRVMR
jgi:phosphoglycolate phosphatase